MSILKNTLSLEQILFTLQNKATPSGTNTNDATATEEDILQDKTAYVKGEKITGKMPIHSAEDLMVAQNEIYIPSGYYADNTIGKVARAARAKTTMSSTANPVDGTLTITASNNQQEGYVLSSNETATTTITLAPDGPNIIATDGVNSVSASVGLSVQEQPNIVVDTNGLITARVKQTPGYTDGSTLVGDWQMNTQGANTIVPNQSTQTAIDKGFFTTGKISVAPIPEKYKDTSNATATAEDIMLGQTAYNADGLVTGSFTLDTELDDQTDLISTLLQAIKGKASGGGTDNSANAFLEGTLEEVNCDGVTEVHHYMFYEKQGLKRVRLANATSVGNYNFYDCDVLESIDLPEATGTIGTYFGYSCKNLVSANLPKATSLNSYAFQSASKIEFLDLPMVGNISNYGFRYCSSLTTVILRKTDAICTLGGSSAFVSTPIASKTGYIYVPSALIENYKGATNWSKYSSQFRAIEDYPDICG